jgi:hypothetical protein
MEAASSNSWHKGMQTLGISKCGASAEVKEPKSSNVVLGSILNWLGEKEGSIRRKY